MKKYILKYTTIAVVIAIASFSSCRTDASQNGLGGTVSADEFEKKISQYPDAQIADVRTPGEYNEGHIKKSLNIDWNGDTFETEIQKLDKQKPVFVYCLSGGRSASAVSKMKDMGFKEIYELDGGMRAWHNNDKPVESATGVSRSEGMSMKEYSELLKTEKLVLVDFNATWCAPCKKMAPIIGELEQEFKDKLQVVKIDVEENVAVADGLKIENIPTLLLYKDGAVIWNHVGLTDKNTLVEIITKN